LSTIFFHLSTKQIYAPSRSFSPSPTATGTRHSVLPHHASNGALTGCLSEDQTRGGGKKKGDAMLRMWDGCGGNYVWW